MEEDIKIARAREKWEISHTRQRIAQETVILLARYENNSGASNSQFLRI